MSHEEPEQESRVRSGRDIAERAVVLYALCLTAHKQLSHSSASAWLKGEHLWKAASPSEKRFFEKIDLTNQDIINATWKAEALWILLWALGRIDLLSKPVDLADPQKILAILPSPQSSVSSFIEDAVRRSSEEINDACDEIFEIHWTVRDAQLNNRTIPLGYHPDVIQERHYALNWLTYYEEEWDEITTDT